MNEQETVWIEGISGQFQGQRIPLQRGDTLLGRSRVCDLQIPAPNVSRQHAKIRYAQGKYYLQDQNSGLGTKVNNRLVPATALKDGDTVTIGPATFQFHREVRSPSPLESVSQPSPPPGTEQEASFRESLSESGHPSRGEQARHRQQESKSLLPVFLGGGLILLLAVVALLIGGKIGSGLSEDSSDSGGGSSAPDVDPWEAAMEETSSLLHQHPGFESRLEDYQETADEVDQYLAFEEEAQEIISTIDALKATNIPLLGNAWEVLVETADVTHPGAGQAFEGLDNILRELLDFKGSLDSLAKLEATRSSSLSFREYPSQDTLTTLDGTLGGSISALEEMIAKIDNLTTETSIYLEAAEVTLEAIDQLGTNFDIPVVSDLSHALQDVIQPVQELDAYITGLRQDMAADKDLMERIAHQVSDARNR